jgi:hypothetical protein
LLDVWQKLNSTHWFDNPFTQDDEKSTTELDPFHKQGGASYISDDVRDIEQQLNYTYPDYPKEIDQLKIWVNKTFGDHRSDILQLKKDGKVKGLRNHFVVNLIYSR